MNDNVVWFACDLIEVWCFCVTVYPWQQSLKHITWFRERHLSEITLGGLLILVLVRTIQYNLTRLRV